MDSIWRVHIWKASGEMLKQLNFGPETTNLAWPQCTFTQRADRALKLTGLHLY